MSGKRAEGVVMHFTIEGPKGRFIEGSFGFTFDELPGTTFVHLDFELTASHKRGNASQQRRVVRWFGFSRAFIPVDPKVDKDFPVVREKLTAFLREFMNLFFVFNARNDKILYRYFPDLLTWYMREWIVGNTHSDMITDMFCDALKKMVG